MLTPLFMPIFACIVLFGILLIMRRLNNVKWYLYQSVSVTFFFFHVEIAF